MSGWTGSRRAAQWEGLLRFFLSLLEWAEIYTDDIFENPWSGSQEMRTKFAFSILGSALGSLVEPGNLPVCWYASARVWKRGPHGQNTALTSRRAPEEQVAARVAWVLRAQPLLSDTWITTYIHRTVGVLFYCQKCLSVLRKHHLVCLQCFPAAVAGDIDSGVT